jgi:hypothetical protein
VKSGIDPCVDYVFKKLYGSEDTAPLLVSLLNAVVGPTRPVTGVQIVLPQTDKAFAEDKLAIGDVVPEIRRALEVLMMFTKDENEREIYELRLKYQRDHNSLVQDAKDAEERGVKKGALMGQIHLCQELLKQPTTQQEELSALPIENLTALLDQLQKQLLPNGD